MKSCLKFIFPMMLSLAALQASAQTVVPTDQNYYIEFGLTPLHVRSEVGDVSHPQAARLTFGKNVHPNWALEGFYLTTYTRDSRPGFDATATHYGLALKPKVAMTDSTDLFARLGWSHGDDEIFSRAQFLEWFDLDHLGRSAAQFDEAKLRWVNAQHMKMASDEQLAQLVKAHLDKRGLAADERLPAICGLFKDRCDTTVVLADWAARFYQDVVPDADEFAAYRERLRAMPEADRRRRLAELCAHFGATLPPPALMSTLDVARWLKCSPDTLEKWRTLGTGPAWIRIGRTVGGRNKRELRTIPRYRVADVERWLAAQGIAEGVATLPRRAGRKK